MLNQRNIQFDKFCKQMADLNGVSNARSEFTVVPTVQQTLEEKIRVSSLFLQQINNLGVKELVGAKVGIGTSGPNASRTDTDVSPRETKSIAKTDSNEYLCKKTDFDTHLKYALIDAWAGHPNFQIMVRNQAIKQQADDRIMIGFNGTSAAATTDLATNPLLQDVNIGWFEHLRQDASAQVKASGNKIGTVAGTDYNNLDALVSDVFDTNIKEEYRNGVTFVALMGNRLLSDKYLPLINAHGVPTEQLALDMIISQKRVGGLQAVTVPFIPAGSIFITPLSNLSIYFQIGGRRMRISDNPERDRIDQHESSNDAYVIEMNERATLIENIELVE